jgi:DNA-binding CsgD family transcriptional regulator
MGNGTSAASIEGLNAGASGPLPSLRPVEDDPTYDAPTRARPRTSRLSGRERGVLEGLARGDSTEEVAAALHVSPHTVRTHVKNALRKLDAKTRAHAVAIALKEGAIELRR